MYMRSILRIHVRTHTCRPWFALDQSFEPDPPKFHIIISSPSHPNLSKLSRIFFRSSDFEARKETDKFLEYPLAATAARWTGLPYAAGRRRHGLAETATTTAL